MKLFKTLAAVAALTLSSIPAMAQGIDFMPEGSKLNDAVAKAKAEGKMVFLDCYTSWCGPCKMMSSRIFPTQEVGDFMNPRYVSIKIDMEKGEGPSLVEKLQISAYPTFIIFNGDGEEVGRFLGGSDATRFIDNVTKNSVDNGSAELQKRFDAGDRDPQFLTDYLTMLSKAYKRKQCGEVAEIILDGKAETFASDSVLTNIFMGHISNPFCPAFVYTAKNPSALIAAIGQMPVTMKLRSVWERYPMTLVSEENGKVSFDTVAFTRFLDLMAECGEPEADRYRCMGLLNYAKRAADWNAYMDAAEAYAASSSVDMDDMTMARVAKPILEDCKDQAQRMRLKTLIDTRLDQIRSGKRQAQTQIGQMKLSMPTDKLLERLATDLANPAPAAANS